MNDTFAKALRRFFYAGKLYGASRYYRSNTRVFSWATNLLLLKSKQCAEAKAVLPELGRIKHDLEKRITNYARP